MNKAAHLISGENAESAACVFLIQKKLQLLAKNVRYRFGELDLIMLDQNTVVFVEVRYRQNQQFGGALASIDNKKCRRIANAAQAWLGDNSQYLHHACRFDVMAISGNSPNLTIDWHTDAFQLDTL
jgi:putative endonuclease